MSEVKTIKFYPRKNKNFTAEDLCILCSPFGFVVSVQKIEQNGLAVGLVTFSHATNATVATKKLQTNKDFIVGLFVKRKLRDVNERKRKSPDGQPHIFQQDHSDDTPPRTRHGRDKRAGLLICNLHSYERDEVFGLFPAGTSIAKIYKRSVRVIVPDLLSAIMLKKVLSELYTGSKSLHVIHEEF